MALEIYQDDSIQDIQKMSYFELIGAVRETNRPPGGVTSVANIAKGAYLNENSHVLEIGTSTGFTAIELAKLVKCSVTAVDVNEESLQEAQRRAEAEGVAEKIKFVVQDASKLDYKDEQFDMVFCGNVTSYLNNKSKCLQEFIRVLKPHGFIAAIPMYYLNEPSKAIVDQVSIAINHNITAQYKKDWVDFFNIAPLSLFLCENYKFDFITNSEVNIFVDKIMQREHLQRLGIKRHTALSNRYQYFMQLFRDNLSLMGFSLMLLRKDIEECDPILFTAQQI
ncbi:MAG: class I SAM-dependent methyltransferase [Gammaproteobacteria bacterium]